MGSAIGDNRGTNLELGVIRGFDARSGQQVWGFDPIPRQAQIPKDSGNSGFDEVSEQSAKWTGARNAWTTFAYDTARDLVFVPTGSLSPDYFGGERPGDDDWANSLVALKASSGALVWARQTVHHDLWDYDLAAEPILDEIEHDGHRVPVVVQLTKMGQIFVFDRQTGADIFPIKEVAVPSSSIPRKYR